MIQRIPLNLQTEQHEPGDVLVLLTPPRLCSTDQLSILL